MVRNYQKKTGRADISEEAVKRAIEDVQNGNWSIRQAADYHGLKKLMLHKRILKIPEDDINIDTPINTGSSKYSTRHVFSLDEETMLEEYLIKCSKMSYGLTYKQVRDFAYSYDKKLNKRMSKGWEEKKDCWHRLD